MTRPTDEQIKALRKGDVVTVRAVVFRPEPDSDGDILVDVPFCGGKENRTYIQPSAIVSIEPREIKVGDRVVRGSSQGTVRYVEGGRAAVYLDGDGLWSYPVADLDRLT